MKVFNRRSFVHQRNLQPHARLNFRSSSSREFTRPIFRTNRLFQDCLFSQQRDLHASKTKTVKKIKRPSIGATSSLTAKSKSVTKKKQKFDINALVPQEQKEEQQLNYTMEIKDRSNIKLDSTDKNRNFINSLIQRASNLHNQVLHALLNTPNTLKGKLEQAEQFYQQALNNLIGLFGPKHTEVASLYNDLGVLYHSQQKYEESKKLLLKGLEIVVKQLGPRHPDAAMMLNNLGAQALNLSQFGEAEILLNQAIEIRKNSVDGAPYTATSINNLASLYLYQKKYKKAEKLIRYLFEIRVTSLGPRDESVAHSLVALSHVFILQGRLDEAEMPYWKALQIYTNALGRQHPYVVSTLERLGALWQLQLKFDKVSKCQKILEVLRAGKDIDENLQSVLWSLVLDKSLSKQIDPNNNKKIKFKRVRSSEELAAIAASDSTDTSQANEQVADADAQK